MLKDKLVEQEKKRITKYIVSDTALAKKLINQASWLSVTIDELQKDIDLNGYTEEFTQSPNTPSYQRERPQVKQLQAFQKNYYAAMKLLFNLTEKKANSEDNGKEEEREFEEFINKGK